MKGVCLVSFSSCLFFFVFNPQKRSRVAFLFSFGENVGFSEGSFEGFEGPFILALEGFEAFEGFEGGFEAFVLPFEAFEGFLPSALPPPSPRPLRPLDLRRLRRLRRSRRGRVPGTSPDPGTCEMSCAPCFQRV